MLLNKEAALKLASYLLDIGAVQWRPQEPFRWASGWLSPIYTDNRLTLSFPQVRSFIKEVLREGVHQQGWRPEAIAGVATGGIPHGALLADALDLPFLYVRSSPKEHGLGNQIEGRLETGALVLVVEDLVSTGQSSLRAVEALRAKGAQVKYVLAIFDYDFPETRKAFDSHEVVLYSICNYDVCMEVAAGRGILKTNDMTILRTWRESPAHWGLE
ncbi:MAG: orotate phosphoribosyltransferase [Flavobacteriales bacterium]|nr:orotate phosphoribosyltransferase [Flavobacteriales bacterium]MCX7768934.1 orotate phosphoribosyltransferase [Flavobacteriales bacterium]MDW8409975.1 orotate phosphoribosyltransferase [Flavobacteriales bacterium]